MARLAERWTRGVKRRLTRLLNQGVISVDHVGMCVSGLLAAKVWMSGREFRMFVATPRPDLPSARGPREKEAGEGNRCPDDPSQPANG